ALWDLVWAGEITNDTLLPLRGLMGGAKRNSHRRNKSTPAAGEMRSPIPEAAGRWFLVRTLLDSRISATDQAAATARMLMNRLGIVTREGVMAEAIPGGFSAAYPILRMMEEAGKIRRGYFIAGRGAAQFADAGAVERLRAMKQQSHEQQTIVLAA